MPDANSKGFEAELARLREEVETRLAAHRAQIGAAIDRLAESRAGADSGGDVSAMRARVAALNVEYQALRARTELETYRLETQVAELEKQIALHEAERVRLKSLLDGLMAEHAECGGKAASRQKEGLHRLFLRCRNFDPGSPGSACQLDEDDSQCGNPDHQSRSRMPADRGIGVSSRGERDLDDVRG